MANTKQRFEVVLKEGSQLKYEGIRQILVDKETGVNYLYLVTGSAASAIPLYNPDGTLIVTPLKDED